MSIKDRFKQCGIVPVVVVENVEDASPLAKALIDGGIDIAEVTFRTAAAEETIRIMSEQYPDMLVGAGTVLTEEQLVKAVEAGAKFIVSPGFDANIVKKAQELGVMILPGAVTPTEIIQAINSGLDTIKFFPAGNYGGLKTIKSLSAPFRNIEFIPTGGVNADNLKDFLEFDKIVAVGGSWICPTNLVDEKNFEEITRLSKEARDIVDSIRK